MASLRNVLFLQGPASSFWRELASAFEDEGHTTFKIHVAFGDELWWRRWGAVRYRGRFSKWEAFLDTFVTDNNITDIIYYADRQPYHVIAQLVAKRRNINAVSVENGYLRPDWITLERGGMGAHSHFPCDPQIIRNIGDRAKKPDLTLRYRHTFSTEIANEIFYNSFNYFYRCLYPFFRSGRYYNIFTDYLSGLLHLLTAGRRRRHAESSVDSLIAADTEFFLVALQLQGDFQIRANSPYAHLNAMIEEVIASFSTHANAAAQLVFKVHPHDNGKERWNRTVKRAAARLGAGNRIQLIDGGDLDLLLTKARGCIVVNSTVGLTALRTGCPTKVLGIAVYDMPGLTHQGSLDAFWQCPDNVDANLADAFVRAIAATIQIKGSFFNPTGRHRAIAEIVQRVANGLVNKPDSFVTPPPRLAQAKAIGVPLDQLR